MKKLILPLMALMLLASCTVHHRHPRTGTLPPGQAKKVTGSKSAKPYAPGQQKKGH